jgi:zinc protease
LRHIRFVLLPRVILNILVAAATFCLIAPASAQSSQSKRAVTDFKLANGLEVVVIPDHRAPVVTHMIWYRVGAADEPAGKSGIAHFLEHLMFKGTKKHPTGEFSAVVAAMGGEENAFTTQDYTAYYQRVPRDKLATVMAYEADRMTNLVLTDEVVKPELNVVLEEYNMRIANRPESQLDEQIDAALYLNHPYGKPVIGWHHEIEKLNRDYALSFYRQHYTPNNAVLVIAGDVDPASVRQLAEDTYGKVQPRAEVAPRRRPQEPPPQAVRSLTLADPRVEQPRLEREYLAPSYHTASPGEAEALQVAAHILGSGSNSRLNQTLVVQRRIALNAGAWYEGTALDDTQFGIVARPRNNVTLPQLEQAIDQVLADFIKNGVTADELQRAKTKMIADSVFAQDSQARLARWYGTALMTGSTVKDVQAWPDRIAAVTAEAVQAAAKKWLQPERSVTGYLVKTGQHREEKRS